MGRIIFFYLEYRWCFFLLSFRLFFLFLEFPLRSHLLLRAFFLLGFPALYTYTLLARRHFNHSNQAHWELWPTSTRSSFSPSVLVIFAPCTPQLPLFSPSEPISPQQYFQYCLINCWSNAGNGNPTNDPESRFFSSERSQCNRWHFTKV